MRTILPFGYSRLGIHSAYDRQIWFSVKQQVILTLVALLVLDMGQSVRILAAAMVGYWIGFLVVLARRPMSPSKGDLLFVRWGCALLAAAFLIAHSVLTVHL
jgi:hypothetical protein